MVFSDPFFLFIFLPLVLGLISLLRGRGHSVAILLFSLLFYYWSSGLALLILIASIVVNWWAGLAMARTRSRLLLVGAIGLNLGLLAFFKYTYFIAGNIDAVIGSKSAEIFANIVLPVGISFFTFQGVSYVVDVWRGDTHPERNPIVFGAYLSFFPQLIAGPIVRFRDVIADYRAPRQTLEDASAGAVRFAHGLAKKVIIADQAGAIADACFAQSGGDLSSGVAWLGALAYAVQIYFDFSGYSDMAIGIGRICGIRFLENFEHPYTASTVTEFWRRWHISLSTWFRDYVYIPLGGNRAGPIATYRNLLLVFLSTGLWHGASWNFVLWGLYHGAFLIGERVALGRQVHQVRGVDWRFFYLLPVVIVGWVLFRAETLTVATAFYAAMLSPFGSGAWHLPPAVLEATTPFSTFMLGIGCLAFFMRRSPAIGVLIGRTYSLRGEAVKLGYSVSVLCISLILALGQDFSPFLYFRF